MLHDLVNTTGSFSIKTRLLSKVRDSEKKNGDCEVLPTAPEVSVAKKASPTETCENNSSDWKSCEAEKRSMVDCTILQCRRWGKVTKMWDTAVEFTDLIACLFSFYSEGGAIHALNTSRKETYLRLGAINNLQ